MNIQTFNGILDRHARLVLAPQLSSAMGRFLLGAALGAGAVSVETMRPQLEMLGIVKGDEIDTGRLAAALRGGFANTPSVSFFGMNFTKDDAEAFLRELNIPESGAPK